LNNFVVENSIESKLKIIMNIYDELLKASMGMLG
jgi:hypothetical protein